MVTDSIGDFLTRIRNALARRKESVSVPSSRILKSIAQILKDEEFIKDFTEGVDEKGRKELNIVLGYKSNKPIIRKIKRVSKPGVRIYMGYREIPKVLGGLGIVILTTPKGVLTGEAAKKAKVGGEILCRVW